MQHLEGTTSHALRYFINPDRASWTEDWQEYRIGKPLTDGEGGTSALFELAEGIYPRMVAKAYTPEAIEDRRVEFADRARIEVLARNNIMLGDRFPWATWPRRLLFKDKADSISANVDNLIGYSMERLQSTRSLHDLLLDPNATPKLTLKACVHIAGCVADQIARLHRHHWEWVLVDLSPANIHVARDYSRVLLIDTDGFQFRDPATGKLYLSQIMTPGHKAPWSDADVAANKPLTPAHDDYCVAILICMIFMGLNGACAPLFEYIGMTEEADDLIKRRAFVFDDPAVLVSNRVRDAFKAIPDPIRNAISQSLRQQTLTCEQWAKLLVDFRRSL